MNPRTTGILFAVAAALAAFVYFYEIRGAEKRQQAEEQKRLFPGLESGAVDALSLTSSDGTAVRLERRDQRWLLVAPLSFPADEFAADAMASALANLASEATLGEAQPPSVYGLEAAERRIAFSAGGQEHVLQLGNKAPVGSNTYASIGGQTAVYTVSTFAVNAFQKTLEDLRRKQILDFDSEAVQKIAASWPGGGVVVERGEGGWQLVEPLQGPADARAVDDLLSDLRYLRAEGFADDPLSDPAAGLSPPEFTALLSLEPGAEGGAGRALRVEIGGLFGDEQRLVRADAPALFRIPASRLGELPRRVVDYRLRQLADFATSDAERLVLEFRPDGGEPVRVEARRQDGRWVSEPEPMAADKISSLLYGLSRLRARDILAESLGPQELRALRLDPPAVTLQVYGAAPAGGAGDPAAAPRLAEVHLGVLRASGGIAAQAAGNAQVFELDAGVAEDVPVSLEAFRGRFVSADTGTEGEGPGDAELDDTPPGPDEGGEPAEPEELEAEP